MDRLVSVARPALWVAVCVAVAFLAIAAFLNDLGPRGWHDWAAAGTIVAGAAGAIVAFRRDSLGRALIWFVSLALMALLIIYDVLDALVDPFMAADWPIAVIAIVLVVGLWTLLGFEISDDE